MEERVILVDENDRELGTEEKLEAHRMGILHRALSTFVFNKKGQLMLQRRNKLKYHSGGLWANTCCTHPRLGEKLLDAAHRRLKEEMGFDCELREVFCFTYDVKLDKGLSEHEFNHVVFGSFDGSPKPNPEEAEDWKWVNLEELQEDIKAQPEKYAAWLRISISKVIEHVRKR